MYTKSSGALNRIIVFIFIYLILVLLFLMGCAVDKTTVTSSPIPTSTETPNEISDAPGDNPIWVFDTETYFISNSGDAQFPFLNIIPTDQLVYITSYQHLYAVDRESGQQVWEFIPETDWGLVSVSVYGNQVYFWAENTIYALDALSGTEVWTLDTEYISGFGMFKAAEEGIYYVSGGSQVLAIEFETGQERWSFDTGSSIFDDFCGNYGSLVITDENVYLGTDENLFALDRNTGVQVWKHQFEFLSDCVFVEAIQVQDGMVYFSKSTDETGTVYALDDQSGQIIWNYSMDLEQYPFTESLIVQDGVVFYVPSFYNKPGGTLVALDGQTGQEIWTHEIEEKDWGGMSLLGHKNNIFLGTSQILYKIDSSIGEAKLYFPLFVEGNYEGGLCSDMSGDLGIYWLTIGESNAYFGSHCGRVYALDLERGPTMPIKLPTPTPSKTPTPLPLSEIPQDPFITFATDLGRGIFSPDGKTIAISDKTKGVEFWDTRTWEKINQIEVSDALDLYYSPNGQILAIWIYKDKVTTIELWDTDTIQMVNALENDKGLFQYMAFSPDSNLVAWEDSGAVFLWDIKTGERLRQVNTIPYDDISHIAFSPDGSILVIASHTEHKDGIVDLLNIQSGKSIRTFGKFESMVINVEFTPDNQHVVISTFDFVKLFEVSTSDEIRNFETDGITSPAFAISPSGEFLATEGDNVVRLFNLSTGNLVCTLKISIYSLMNIQFSPDESLLVASEISNNDVFVWDIKECTK